MKSYRAILGGISLALAIPASGAEPASPPAEQAAPVRIAAGTSIALVTRDSISTRKNVKGDLLYLKVAEPVVVDGITAIPAGTIVVAQLTRADQRGAFGKSGKLDVQLLYAELASGPLRVSGMLEARGKRGADDGLATAALFFLLPSVATGRSAEMPAGSEVSGRLDRDLWVARR